MLERELSDREILTKINILKQEVKKNTRWRRFQQWLMGISIIVIGVVYWCLGSQV